MIRAIVTGAIVAIAAFALTPAFAVTQWQATPDAKTIGWSLEAGKGNLLNGHCSAFTSDIAFDAADLTHSNVDVVIDMATCRTGSEEEDASLPNSEWFDQGKFPKAEFKATKFRNLGGNHYAADGTLTLKGVSKPLTLDFTLDIKGAAAHMLGTTTIQRMDFGVGATTSGDYVDLAVKVKIDLNATRK